MPDDKPDTFIAAVRKNGRERIGVALRSFKGHRFVDVRVQYPEDGDVWKWTGKGVAVQAGMLDDLIDALGQAREAARAEGLLLRASK